MRYEFHMILGTILVLMLSGCSVLSPFRALTTDPLEPPTETETTTKYEKLHDRERGIDYTRKETYYNKEIKEITLAQRIGALISGLSTWAVILIIAGLILFPGATIAFLVGRMRALGKALFQTVKGIQYAKRSEGKFLEFLRAEQDEQTRQEVNRLRAKV